MKIGIKLKDGSIWTAISFSVIDGYENTRTKDIPLTAITEITAVKYEIGYLNTHPYNANFYNCFYENFKPDDERIESINRDVFEYIDDYMGWGE